MRTMAITIDNEYKQERMIEDDEPVLQVRVKAGEGILHLQGYGLEANRNYGFAEKFFVPLQVTDWLALREPEYFSFASSEKMYIRGVAVVQYNDGVQLLIDGEGGNHNMGTHFVLDMNTNKPLVAQLMDFVNNNDLLTVVNENRWVAE